MTAARSKKSDEDCSEQNGFSLKQASELLS